jgi:hypothetical protein
MLRAHTGTLSRQDETKTRFHGMSRIGPIRIGQPFKHPAATPIVRVRPLNTKLIALGETVKSGLAVLYAAALLTSSTVSADARSCTEQGRACASWASNNIMDPGERKYAIDLCVGPRTTDCIARCKQGQKYFVGITGTQNYPIQTCQ